MTTYTKDVLKDYATSLLCALVILLFIVSVISLNEMLVDRRIRKATHPLIQRIELLEYQHALPSKNTAPIGLLVITNYIHQIK